MAQYAVNNANFTPATTQDNWALDTNATTAIGKVKWFSWGGNLNTASSYRTRWYRPTTVGSGTFTALTTQGGNPATTAIVRAGTFATQLTPPTEPAGLFEVAWNAFGGGGTIILPIGGEWLMLGNGATTVASQIGCRNALGTDANGSSYSATWEE